MLALSSGAMGFMPAMPVHTPTLAQSASPLMQVRSAARHLLAPSQQPLSPLAAEGCGRRKRRHRPDAAPPALLSACPPPAHPQEKSKALPYLNRPERLKGEPSSPEHNQRERPLLLHTLRPPRRRV